MVEPSSKRLALSQIERCRPPCCLQLSLCSYNVEGHCCHAGNFEEGCPLLETPHRLLAYLRVHPSAKRSPYPEPHAFPLPPSSERPKEP